MPLKGHYQGGVLDLQARITIQVMHRIGALLTALYIGWLGAWLILSAKTTLMKNLGAITLIVLIMQITLGVLNIVWKLPLSVAVMHTAVAALLLISVISINFCLLKKPTEKNCCQ